MGDTYTLEGQVYKVFCQDRDLRLNKLVDIMMESSANHSHQVERGLDYKGSWIILQWDIHIEKLPQAYKNIKVNTYSNFFNKFYAYRNFKIYQGDELIVDAKVKFMILNLESRKPMRVPENLQEAYSSESDREKLPYIDYKIREEDLAYKLVEEIRPRKTDIDENFHVNNARYVEWIENHLDRIDDIGRIEILYKHEIMYGQEVCVYKYEDDKRISFKLKSDDKLNAIINLTKKIDS